MKIESEKIEFISNEAFRDKILSAYPWAIDYSYYYIYVFYASRESIIAILDDIPENDRKDSTLEKAYYYLQKYEKEKINMAVIIPTYNRPKAIKYLLEFTSISYRRRCVDIIVYDSSDNDATEIIVNEFMKKGYLNVIYKRYDGLFDGFSLDHKIISAYKEFYQTYDYLWICRDGLIPLIDEIIEKIIYFKHKKVGCIIVDTISRNYGVQIERYYKNKEDCNDFLKEQATRLQTLGMLIFSKEFIKNALYRVPLSEKTYSLWQMAVPFYSFVEFYPKIVFFTRNVFAENIGASNTHFWSKAENLFEQWSYRWINVINSLPQEYDEKIKKECFMIYTIDFHPFSPATIIKMRTQGGLNYKIVKKYKKYIKLVTKTPLWYFYLVALTPKSMVKIVQFVAYNNIKLARKVIKKITNETE